MVVNIPFMRLRFTIQERAERTLMSGAFSYSRE